MSKEHTQLIISIQGKRGAGKSVLAAQVIEPVMKAIGAKLENKTDKETGVFLTYAVPVGAMGQAGTIPFYSPDQVDQLVAEGIAAAAPAEGVRVGFHNSKKILSLLQRRAQLEGFVAGKADDDLAVGVAKQILPADLRGVLGDGVVALLHKEAAAKIKAIDAELKAEGFDTRTKLPAA